MLQTDQQFPRVSSQTESLVLYGPLESWFDKTWRPGDIELVDSAERE